MKFKINENVIQLHKNYYILISNDLVTNHDWYVDLNDLSINYKNTDIVFNPIEHNVKKIIASIGFDILNIPRLYLNVNVEKIAIDSLKQSGNWNHLFIDDKLINQPLLFKSAIQLITQGFKLAKPDRILGVDLFEFELKSDIKNNLVTDEFNRIYLY